MNKVAIGCLLLLLLGCKESDALSLDDEALINLYTDKLESPFVGKPQLVMLFQPNCGFCVKQMKHMQALANKCSAVAIQLYGFNGSAKELRNELIQHQISLPAYRTNKQFLDQLNEIKGTPTNLIFNSEGGLVLQHMGYWNESILRTQLKQMSNQTCG